jgi:hypothetical protein
MSLLWPSVSSQPVPGESRIVRYLLRIVFSVLEDGAFLRVAVDLRISALI